MTPPVTSLPPQATEEALHVLEEASTEHLDWLKRVHCALLFHGDDTAAAAKCRAVEDGLVEKLAEQGGESRSAFLRLKKTREHMEQMGDRLSASAARGDRLNPETYMAFMEAVESYHSEGRQVELLLHQALAETDPLTGLHNRRGMMRDLNREWMRANRTGNPCCVALVDIDHFKTVNDVHGHLTGDQVLCATARFFQRRLRPYDLVYRFGGEEFLFCLPNTGLRQAKRVLERLRLLLARLVIHGAEGQRLGISVSIGLAELTPQTAPETAIGQADHALYAAKNGGRNRVCMADGEGLD